MPGHLAHSFSSALLDARENEARPTGATVVLRGSVLANRQEWLLTYSDGKQSRAYELSLPGSHDLVLGLRSSSWPMEIENADAAHHIRGRAHIEFAISLVVGPTLRRASGSAQGSGEAVALGERLIDAVPRLQGCAGLRCRRTHEDGQAGHQRRYADCGQGLGLRQCWHESPPKRVVV